MGGHYSRNWDRLVSWLDKKIKAQSSQKHQYDKTASSDQKIQEGDLVMLRVKPCFKLDRPFRGPYRVHTVTSTCVHIQLINQPDAELITVSLQRLSHCRSQEIGKNKPWIGHGRTNKRRQLRKTNHMHDSVAHTDNNNPKEHNFPEVRRTRQGRIVKQPAWYRLNITLLQGSARRQGEGCKAGSRGKIT